MTRIDAMTLMAYIDGELDAPERWQVERALEQDPQLQQQLEQMCRLDTLLGAAFNDALHGQQPELRALRSRDSQPAAGRWWQGVVAPFSWQPVAAAALLVVGVFVGGWFERQSQTVVSAAHQQQQLLQQAIDQALETHLSGDSLQWRSDQTEQSGSITPVRTYRSEQGQFCREYIDRREDTGQINEQRGVACRGETGWKIMAIYYL